MNQFPKTKFDLEKYGYNTWLPYLQSRMHCTFRYGCYLSRNTRRDCSDISYSRRRSATKRVEQRSPESFVLSTVVEYDEGGGGERGNVRGMVARMRARGFASSTATKTWLRQREFNCQPVMGFLCFPEQWYATSRYELRII